MKTIREVTVEGKTMWEIRAVRSNPESGREDPLVVWAENVAVATGHHSTPNHVSFPGMDGFTGTIMHSVDYKAAKQALAIGDQKMKKKKNVCVVGIGNSAVDVAVNLVPHADKVYLSTRSGAWVIPNYILGYATDLYACRLFLWLPWKLSNAIFEAIVTLLVGSPYQWGLNPVMRALQSQPTVSGTLVYHIQREEVLMKGNIQRFNGDRVLFTDGSEATVDTVVMCTGYKINLPFLSDDLREKVFDKNCPNSIRLYKNVFAPALEHDRAHTLAFIGFVQPASGGLVTMSETQARWWMECVCSPKVSLPRPLKMEQAIQQDEAMVRARWTGSSRHTIQRDPLIYNDELASFFGAKPSLAKYPMLAWRLLLGSCGAWQWRLQGPHSWKRAKSMVRKTPVTPMMKWSGIALAAIAMVGGYKYVSWTNKMGAIGERAAKYLVLVVAAVTVYLLKKKADRKKKKKKMKLAAKTE